MDAAVRLVLTGHTSCKSLNANEILRIVKRRFWLLVVPPVFGLFGALLYSSTIPNLYTSDMLIAIDPQRVPDAFVRSTVTVGAEQRLNSIAVQVLSRNALEDIITSLDLYPAMRAKSPTDEVIEVMRRDIVMQVERPRTQGNGSPTVSAFHVMYTYTDPATAAKVTQILGNRFVESNASERSKLAQSTDTFLESQLAESRKRLESQELRLEAFRQRHGKELPTQLQSNMQALSNAQLQVQSLVESLARDRDRKLVLERLYREAREAPPAPAAAATGAEPATASAEQRLAAARTALAGLEAKYTADHPDVTRARRQVADLERQAAAESAAGQGRGSARQAAVDPARLERLQQMAAELESLDRQTSFKESEERRIRAEIAEYQRRIEAVPGLESEFIALTRDYDTQQTAYKELLAKSSAAEVAKELEDQDIAERFRIVDEANVPVRPQLSARWRYNVGGLGVAILLSLALVAFLELRDSSFRTDTEVMEVLSLPVLASVPYVASAAEEASRQRVRLIAAAAGTVSLVVMAYLAVVRRLWESLT